MRNNHNIMPLYCHVAQAPLKVKKTYEASQKSPSLEKIMIDFLNKRIKKMDDAIAKIDADFPHLA